MNLGQGSRERKGRQEKDLQKAVRSRAFKSSGVRTVLTTASYFIKQKAKDSPSLKALQRSYQEYSSLRNFLLAVLSVWKVLPQEMAWLPLSFPQALIKSTRPQPSAPETLPLTPDRSHPTTLFHSSSRVLITKILCI